MNRYPLNIYMSLGTIFGIVLAVAGLVLGVTGLMIH